MLVLRGPAREHGVCFAALRFSRSFSVTAALPADGPRATMKLKRGRDYVRKMTDSRLIRTMAISTASAA